MDAFQPLINILTVLTALSVAAERITNLLKLQSPSLRVTETKPGEDKEAKKDAEKARESAIARRSVLVGIGVAIVLKADLIAILRNAQAPWETLGWFGLDGEMMVSSAALQSPTAIATALIGSVAAGFALGFGSKFWHELLDGVLELRNMAKNKNKGAGK
jgi:hypothetical protein